MSDKPPSPPQPIPTVSARAYERAAKVRMRVKGSDSEGAVFEGQVEVIPCRGCKPLAKQI